MLGGLRSYVHGLGVWQRGVVSTVVNACVWTLVYFLFLRTPLPAGWTVQTAELVCLGAGMILGALACMTSKRVWPVAVGAAAGIVMGGAEAVVSDTSVSYWQRASGGLALAPFPLCLWFVIIVSCVVSGMALRRWRLRVL